MFISLRNILAAFLAVALPLSAAQRGPAPTIVATPLKATGIYAAGEKAGWTITPAPGATPPAGDFSYTVKTNNAATIKTGTFSLATGSATIEVTHNEPAMLYVQVTAPVAPAPAAAPADGADPPDPAAARRGGAGRGGRGGGAVLTLGAAVAPTKIKPAVPRPADFDAFWDAKLAELAKIPINPVLTRTETTREGIEFYTVKLDSVGSHVQGYLAKPAREGKFPAIIQFQYAGVYALSPASSQDRAAEGWLAFNVDSHDIPPTEGQQQHPELGNYQSQGNTDRETAYFLKMYLRDARAVDYIKSRPDWDGKTIVFQGISMGGQQSLATAGLRSNDVTAVLVLVPSGADIAGSLHGRTAGYPNWGTNDPKVAATAPYFDTINFAPRIKAPVLMAMGFIDTIAPPVGNWTVLNQIPGAKEAVPLIDTAHNNQATAAQLAPYENRAKEVRDLILKGGKFTPDEKFTKP
jgi:cephalosporin-C deacetylase-like acetyl esterase